MTKFIPVTNAYDYFAEQNIELTIKEKGSGGYICQIDNSTIEDEKDKTKRKLPVGEGNDMRGSISAFLYLISDKELYISKDDKEEKIKVPQLAYSDSLKPDI